MATNSTHVLPITKSSILLGVLTLYSPECARLSGRDIVAYNVGRTFDFMIHHSFHFVVVSLTTELSRRGGGKQKRVFFCLYIIYYFFPHHNNHVQRIRF